MKQSGVIYFCFGMNALFVETGEGGSGSDAVEAMAVIEKS